MKKHLSLALTIVTLAVAASASAQVYGAAPCAPAVPCPPAQKAYLIPDATSCYRTAGEPCLNPIQGVTGVLGKIFAPRCYDTCKPCAPCL